MTKIDKMKNYFQNTYKKFSARTSLHGFGELYAAKSLHGKLFWFIALSICIGITTFQLSRAIVHYVSEPYITVIERIKEGEILYPNLSICYDHWMYWVDFKLAGNLSFTKHSVLYGMSFLTDIYTEEVFSVEKAKEQFELSMVLNNFTRISEFYFAIAKSAPNKRFNEKYLDEERFCYKTNSMKLIQTAKRIAKLIMKSDQPRIGLGFRKNEKLLVGLELNDKSVDALTDGFMSRHEHDCYIAHHLSLNSFYGVKEEFFDPNRNINSPLLQLSSFLLIDRDFVELRWDDQVVYIQSHASVSKWQNTTGLPCQKNKISLKSNNTCHVICAQENRRRRCSCSFFEEIFDTKMDYFKHLCPMNINFIKTTDNCIKVVSKSRPRRVLLNSTSLNCTLNKQLCCKDSESDENEYNQCNKKCMPGCTIWNYYLGYVQRVKISWFKDAVIKNSVTVNIVFPTADEVLSTSEIENQSFEKFIGSIGGLLGIWTGASVLSLLHVIYLCCCCELNCCATENEIR